MGNTRIKAFFEGDILLQHFCFVKSQKNIENILKYLQILLIWLLHRLEMSRESF
jgi:hypothetical protein